MQVGYVLYLKVDLLTSGKGRKIKFCNTRLKVHFQYQSIGVVV